MTISIVANTVVPIYYLFDKSLAIPSLISLVIIILLESLLLKLFIKIIKWRTHLFYATIINTASSIIGSIFSVIGNSSEVSDFLWKYSLAGIFLPFVLTIFAEFIFVRWLYRKAIKTIKAIFVTLVINVVSYVILGFLLLFISYLLIDIHSNYIDNKKQSKWNYQEILKNETGQIYTVKQWGSLDVECFLDKYNVNDMQWQEVQNSRNNNDIVFYYQDNWDISKNFLVYPTGDQFSILDRANLSQIKEVREKADFLAISPNEKFIAILTETKYLGVAVDENSYTPFGAKATLKIYSFETDNIILKEDSFICNDGILWSKDSRKLLLTSFESKNILPKNIKKEDDWTIIINKNYPKYVCEYNIETKTIKTLFKGTYPELSPDEKKVLFIRDGKLMLYHFDTQNEIIIDEENHYTSIPQWSPTGRNIVGFMHSAKPMDFSFKFIVVVNVENPEQKFMGHDYHRQ